jgi:hypothetical protein
MIKGNLSYMNTKMIKSANLDDTLRRYESESRLEFMYVELAWLLDISDAWVTREGSALDEFLKIDIVIEQDSEGLRCLVFQVKSSDKGANKHLSLETVTYRGKEYSVPPVLVPDRKMVDLLRELSEFTRIPIRKEILDLLEVSSRSKGKDLPAVLFKPEQLRAITLLCLGKIQGGHKGTVYF